MQLTLLIAVVVHDTSCNSESNGTYTAGFILSYSNKRTSKYFCHLAASGAGVRKISGFGYGVTEIFTVLRFWMAQVGWFVTNISGQHVGLIFKGQNVKEVFDHTL